MNKGPGGSVSVISSGLSRSAPRAAGGTVGWRIAGAALMGLVLGLGAAGCVDNVTLCEEWVASMECGDTDFDDLVTCEDYQGRHCSLYDYFDCLTENAVCDGSAVDTSMWSECEPLDSCGR
jgi:hypothetical protein